MTLTYICDPWWFHSVLHFTRLSHSTQTQSSVLLLIAMQLKMLLFLNEPLKTFKIWTFNDGALCKCEQKRVYAQITQNTSRAVKNSPYCLARLVSVILDCFSFTCRKLFYEGLLRVKTFTLGGESLGFNNAVLNHFFCFVFFAEKWSSWFFTWKLLRPSTCLCSLHKLKSGRDIWSPRTQSRMVSSECLKISE